MSTKIKTDDGNVEFEVCHLGINVTDHHEQEAIWARLSDAQRVELAAALDPGRRGLHVRLDNQAATLATYRRERDEALRKKGEAFDRAVRAERERDAAVARAEDAARERDGWRAAAEHRGGLLNQSVPAVTREDVEKVVHGSGGGFFDSRLDAITDAVCALFGIEAEQATDPVAELASQIETATRDAIRTVVDSLTAVAPGLTPPDVEGLLDQTIRDQSHTLAAYVLGQEASSDE